MSKAKSQGIDLLGFTGRMGKVCNNLLKPNDETAFTLPFVEVMIDAEMLCKLTRDVLTWRSWFDTRPDGVVVRCDWWESLAKPEIELDDVYSLESVLLKLPGDRGLEFGSIEAESEDGDDIPGGRLTKIRLSPNKVGGLTEMKFHLMVRPGLSHANTNLQKVQNSVIGFSFGQARLVTKAQGSLDFGTPTPTGTPVGAAMGAPVYGYGEPIDLHDDSSIPTSLPGISSYGDNSGLGPGAPVFSTSTGKVGEIVDGCDELNGKHPDPDAQNDSPTMGGAGWPPPENNGKPMTPEEQAEFERGAAKQVEAYNARPGHVTDGTTPRSRARRQTTVN